MILKLTWMFHLNAGQENADMVTVEVLKKLPPLQEKEQRLGGRGRFGGGGFSNRRGGGGGNRFGGRRGGGFSGGGGRGGNRFGRRN